VRHILHPLVQEEYEDDAWKPKAESVLVPLAGLEEKPMPRFPRRTLENRLVFGDLPGIAILEDDSDRAEILSAYATAYLEEEMRLGRS
jgi:hypothetical protein